MPGHRWGQSQQWEMPRRLLRWPTQGQARAAAPTLVEPKQSRCTRAFRRPGRRGRADTASAACRRAPLVQTRRAGCRRAVAGAVAPRWVRIVRSGARLAPRCTPGHHAHLGHPSALTLAHVWPTEIRRVQTRWAGCGSCAEAHAWHPVATPGHQAPHWNPGGLTLAHVWPAGIRRVRTRRGGCGSCALAHAWHPVATLGHHAHVWHPGATLGHHAHVWHPAALAPSRVGPPPATNITAGQATPVAASRRGSPAADSTPVALRAAPPTPPKNIACGAC